MAQLTDDCFAFDGPLLPIADAERLMAGQVSVVAECENVTLANAMGRVLAEDLHAPIPLPSFDNSAVDGYAVRHADVAAGGETRLPIVAYMTAGKSFDGELAAGQAARIFTGAPMPQGADTVYMQEDCRLEDAIVVVPAGLKRGANRRLAGEDIAAGDVAIAAGRRLGPADVALAAAIGFDRLRVRRRVRVALVLHRRRNRRGGSEAAARRALRFQPLSAARHARTHWRGGGRSRNSDGSIPTNSPLRSARRRPITTSS